MLPTGMRGLIFLGVAFINIILLGWALRKKPKTMMIPLRSWCGYTGRNAKKKESPPPNCSGKSWTRQWKEILLTLKKYARLDSVDVLGLNWNGWNPSALLIIFGTGRLQTLINFDPFQPENLR